VFYSVLQGVAGCCMMLQCVAVCCSVLQCVAVHVAKECNINDMSRVLSVRDIMCFSFCHVLPCVAVCCRVLPCVVVCCSKLQYVLQRNST